MPATIETRGKAHGVEQGAPIPSFSWKLQGFLRASNNTGMALVNMLYMITLHSDILDTVPAGRREASP